MAKRELWRYRIATVIKGVIEGNAGHHRRGWSATGIPVCVHALVRTPSSGVDVDQEDPKDDQHKAYVPQ